MGYAGTDSEQAVLEVRCRGHLDLEDMRGICAALEARAAGRVPFGVLIDVREVVSYDPAARAHAAAWARTPPAALVRAVAVVADSHLLAADSPATALAPGQARLFGEPRAARAELLALLFPASGEFVRPGARGKLGRATGSGESR